MVTWLQPVEEANQVNDEWPAGTSVAFGHSILANPDFVERVKEGAEFRTYQTPTLFNTLGAEGYTDLPIYDRGILHRNDGLKTPRPSALAFFFCAF